MRLDRLIERAVAAAERMYGSADDPFRGLHITLADVERLLGRAPGAPTLWVSGDEVEASSVGETERLAWLARTFDLTAFDLDVLLLALAPELDLRYERLYAYLQDDVTRRRPTVDLALNLLCASAGERLARRARFAPDAPLVRHALMHLTPDPNQVEPPLLAHYLKMDEQIARLMLDEANLDRRLAPFCELNDSIMTVNELAASEELKRALRALARQAQQSTRPLRLFFRGAPGAGRRTAAAALAQLVSGPLLIANLERAPGAGDSFIQLLHLLFREARLLGAVLYLDGIDALHGTPRHRDLIDALAGAAGITIMAGSQPWVPGGRTPDGVLTVTVALPDLAVRRDSWAVNLLTHGVTIDERDLDTLAARFRMTPVQIANAAATAQGYASMRAPETDQAAAAQMAPAPDIDDLFAAARAQAGHELAGLARKVEPRATWDDIVLPDDTKAQLQELCQWVAQRERVLGAWGFGQKLSHGTGVSVLFAGSSGTGKTMAAEIMAGKLGLDLYEIDLAGVVSKYIGETEKNLDQIFAAAENANAILFFDEADALFGKRSEVNDSHDRYANIEISYLLQKIEQYQGLAILATNLRENLDDAFVRRLAFVVHFPFPDEAERRLIWARIWPSAKLLSDDVDLDFLARQFKLSGGNIKNIALAAAFLAADGEQVRMEHLLHATEREYQKLGKILSEAELYGAYEMA